MTVATRAGMADPGAEPAASPEFDFEAAVALARDLAEHVAGRGADCLCRRLDHVESLIHDERDRRSFRFWLPSYKRQLATQNLSLALLNGSTSVDVPHSIPIPTTLHQTGLISEPVSSSSSEGARR